jgi:MFS family permease
MAADRHRTTVRARLSRADPVQEPGLHRVAAAGRVHHLHRERGGFLLLGGRAADLLGRRRVLMVGLALFTVSSLGCGLATEDWVLIPMPFWSHSRIAELIGYFLTVQGLALFDSSSV